MKKIMIAVSLVFCLYSNAVAFSQKRPVELSVTSPTPKESSAASQPQEGAQYTEEQLAAELAAKEAEIRGQLQPRLDALQNQVDQMPAQIDAAKAEQKAASEAQFAGELEQAEQDNQALLAKYKK